MPRFCAGAGQACHQGLVCFPAQPRQLLGSLAILTGVPMVSTHVCGSLPLTSLWGCVLAACGGLVSSGQCGAAPRVQGHQPPVLLERHGVREHRYDLGAVIKPGFLKKCCIPVLCAGTPTQRRGLHTGVT